MRKASKARERHRGRGSDLLCVVGAWLQDLQHNDKNLAESREISLESRKWVAGVGAAVMPSPAP